MEPSNARICHKYDSIPWIGNNKFLDEQNRYTEYNIYQALNLGHFQFGILLIWMCVCRQEFCSAYFCIFSHSSHFTIDSFKFSASFYDFHWRWNFCQVLAWFCWLPTTPAYKLKHCYWNVIRHFQRHWTVYATNRGAVDVCLRNVWHCYEMEIDSTDTIRSTYMFHFINCFWVRVIRHPST